MALKNRLYFLSILFSLLFAYNAKAQDENERQSLADILVQIQQQYNYQFNYAEETIEDIFLVSPKKELSFLQILDYLRYNTGLVFTLIDNNFVTIKKSEPLIICGFLKAKDDQSPLISATIQSKNSSTVSDENGFFELPMENENEMIVIRHIGYKTSSISLMDLITKSCIDIFLESELQSLSEVVISNYIVNGINKMDNGVFEIDFSNFDILPGLIETDVLQSVLAFPGIQSENETVSNINIRGGTHDQNLILWDDIKMYQSGHFFGLISMYNPQITETVSLLKNGTDVRYTDGTSGTISMKTQEQVNSVFSANLGVNFIDANGFADIPLGKKSSLQLAARKSINEFVQTPTYDQFFDRVSQNTEVEMNTGNSINSNKDFDFYDTSLRWIYEVSPKDEIRINFINVANELVFDENAVVNAIEESRQSKVSQKSIAAGFYYKRTWNHKWQTNVSIYETDYKLKAINENILSSQRFLQENKVSETSFKLNAIYRINERLRLLNGYHFVETKITNLDDVDNPLFRSLVSEVVRTHAVYCQISYVSPNKDTNFNAGLRLNYIDKFKKEIFEPRISFNQKFLTNFTLEILGEFKHQNTSQVINFQNDFLGIEKRRWQLSNNEDIPVIISRQISLGINYSHLGWLLSAEGYLKNVDGITAQSQGFQNQYEFIKTKGSYEVKGLDVLIRKRLGDFNTWISYSYMDNIYTFEALPEVTFSNNLDIEHAFNFGLSYSKNHLKIATGLNWHSGKPTTFPIEGSEISDNEVNFNEANSSHLGDYMRLDVSTIYDFNINQNIKAKIGVSIWNVLDKTNTINTIYRVNDGNLITRDQSSLGLTPNVMLRVIF